MRRLLKGKWWFLHVTVLVAVLVMLRLGLWQWHRANSPSGGIQNYAYAFQWPLFAVFAIVLWIRTLIDESRRDPDSVVADPAPNNGPVHPDTEIIRQPGLRIGISAPAQVDTADDPEVAAWNARLAALNAASNAIDARRR